MGSLSRFMFYGLVSICIWVVATIAITVSVSFLTTQYLTLGIGLGIAIWLYVSTKILNAFTVSVPEVTGLVTVNLVTGALRVYSTGFHFRFPWEQVREGNYINLRLMKTEEKTETFPSKDGPVILAKWSLQYSSSVEQLPAYIAVDEETINKGLNEVASSFLAVKIRDMETEQVRERATKEELEQTLFEHFRQAAKVRVSDPDGTFRMVPLEDFYGISIKLVTISDVDFEKSYQEARSADRIMREYKKTAQHLKDETDGSITNKDALDSVLMVAGKGVTKTVTQETKVFDVTPAVANALQQVAEAFINHRSN